MLRPNIIGLQRAVTQPPRTAIIWLKGSYSVALRFTTDRADADPLLEETDAARFKVVDRRGDLHFVVR